MSNLRPALKQLINERDLIGIEIGTYRGVYALVYLEELDIKKVFLIDSYEGGASNKEEGAHLLLKDYEDKTEWIKAKSANVANRFNNESLDFVYIDGDHQYEAVLQDISLYYPKVKKGGLVSGHDYGRRWRGVPIAVNEFCKKNNFKLNTEGIDWWIWK